MEPHQILIRPIISEKNTMLNEQGQYVFEVDQRATKIMVRKAVEELFNVNVTAEQLPTEVHRAPTSLLVELGEPVDRARLLAAILLEIERQYDVWISAGGAAARR